MSARIERVKDLAEAVRRAYAQCAEETPVIARDGARRLLIADVRAVTHLGCGCWTGIDIRLTEGPRPARESDWYGAVACAGKLLQAVTSIASEIGCDGASTASHSYPSSVLVSLDGEDDLYYWIETIAFENGSLVLGVRPVSATES